MVRVVVWRYVRGRRCVAPSNSEDEWVDCSDTDSGSGSGNGNGNGSGNGNAEESWATEGLEWFQAVDGRSRGLSTHLQQTDLTDQLRTGGRAVGPSSSLSHLRASDESHEQCVPAVVNSGGPSNQQSGSLHSG